MADRNRKRKKSSPVRTLLWLLALGMTVWGIMNVQTRTELTHREDIVWEAYEPGMEAGTYVRLQVREAEPWLFTQVTKEVSVGTGASKYRYKLYTEYGYSLGADTQGREILLRQSQLINDMTELRSEMEWRRDFRDEVRSYAGSAAGTEIFGIIAETAGGEELDYSYYLVGGLGLVDAQDLLDTDNEVIREARERMESLSGRVIVEPFTGAKPSSVEVHDGWKTEPGPGVVWLLLVPVPLLLLLVLHLADRKKAKEAEKRGAAEAQNAERLRQELLARKQREQEEAARKRREAEQAAPQQSEAAGQGRKTGEGTQQTRSTGDRKPQKLTRRDRELQKKAEERRRAQEAAARAQALEEMTRKLEKTTREIPPSGARVASAQGLLQLLEYASVVVPDLCLLEQEEEIGGALRSCRDSRPEEVLQILERLLSRSSEILSMSSADNIEGRWDMLDSYQLACGWKAFRFFEEMSVGDDLFTLIRELLTEQLLSMEKREEPPS